MRAVFGNFEMGDFVISGEPFPVVIVHEVQLVCAVQTEEEADDMLGEHLSAYVIPELNKSEILFANANAAREWEELV